MSKLRIAVAGAGLIGRTHIQVLGQSPSAELCAVADPAPASAALAAQQGVPHFEDLAELLSQVRPDGVILATPNALHVPQALQCLEIGRASCRGRVYSNV